MYDDNVEIKQLTYVSQIKISKPIELESYKGCISSVFNNESSEFKSGIHLRFKRVSNFSKAFASKVSSLKAKVFLATVMSWHLFQFNLQTFIRRIQPFLKTMVKFES